MTPEEARQALEEDKQQRARDCAAEIEAALKKYNCALTARPVYTDDGRTVAEVGIMPQ